MLLSLIATLSTLPLGQVSDAEIWRRLDLYPSYQLLCQLEIQGNMNPYLKDRVERVKFPLVRRSIYLRAIAFQDLHKAKLLQLAQVAAEHVKDRSTEGFAWRQWKERRNKLDEQMFLSYQWPTDALTDWDDNRPGRLALPRPDVPSPMRGRFRDQDAEWKRLARLKNPRRYFESCDEHGLVVRDAEKE